MSLLMGQSWTLIPQPGTSQSCRTIGMGPMCSMVRLFTSKLMLQYQVIVKEANVCKWLAEGCAQQCIRWDWTHILQSLVQCCHHYTSRPCQTIPIQSFALWIFKTQFKICRDCVLPQVLWPAVPTGDRHFHEIVCRLLCRHFHTRNRRPTSVEHHGHRGRAGIGRLFVCVSRPHMSAGNFGSLAAEIL